MTAPPAAIAPERLQEAAQWLVRMHEGPLDEETHRAWRAWRACSDEHARAWQRAECLTGLLAGVPRAVGATPLRQSRHRQRRAVLGAIAGLLAGATPLAWLARQQAPWQYAMADHTTRVGERRQLRLPDGSRLHLNTDTRVDLRFDAGTRLLVLLRGEIQIDTAPDMAIPARPLRVDTRDGRMQALGTRFSVRLFDTATRLTVQAGAVRVSPQQAGTTATTIPAGHSIRFDAAGAGPPAPATGDAEDWVSGLLRADATPLSEIVAELARYRSGVLRCDPAVAAIPVSGVFRLDDIDQALALLGDAFPVRIVTRTRYWTTVAPR